MKELTRENLAKAKHDLMLLTSPGYGGFNLLYGDGYYAISLERKWGDLKELDKAIKTMEEEIRGKATSLEGAGI